MKNLSVLAFVGVVIAAFACAVLTACTRQEPLLAPRTNFTFQTTVHVVEEGKIRAQCAALGAEYEANGCTAYNLDRNTCDIYVMPQRFQQDEERLVIIGHELWHCMHGKWHN